MYIDRNVINAYIRKAQSGNAEDIFQLGELFYRGEEYGRAVECYQKAADRKHAKAMSSLAYMLLNGKGTSVDYNNAEYWFYKALKLGNANSAYYLGVIYYCGYGKDVDLEKAEIFFREGIESGASNSKKCIAAISKMRSVQRKERYTEEIQMRKVSNSVQIHERVEMQNEIRFCKMVRVKIPSFAEKGEIYRSFGWVKIQYEGKTWEGKFGQIAELDIKQRTEIRIDSMVNLQSKHIVEPGKSYQMVVVSEYLGQYRFMLEEVDVFVR